MCVWHKSMHMFLFTGVLGFLCMCIYEGPKLVSGVTLHLIFLKQVVSIKITSVWSSSRVIQLTLAFEHAGSYTDKTCRIKTKFVRKWIIQFTLSCNSPSPRVSRTETQAETKEEQLTCFSLLVQALSSITATHTQGFHYPQ